MPNHYHLFVQTPESGLKSFMQGLNARYARYFNDRNGRVGPLFQGRYRALVIQTDTRVRTLIRYLHRNPLAAGLAERPEDWRWSSCGYYLGSRSGEALVECDLVDALHGESVQAARELMRRELERPGNAEREWHDVITGGLIAGSEQFIQSLQRSVIPIRTDGSVSRLRDLRRPPKEVIDALSSRIAMLGLAPRDVRPVLVYALHRSTSLEAGEIAKLVGLPSSTAVGQVIWRTKSRRARDPVHAKKLDRLDSMLRGVKP